MSKAADRFEAGELTPDGSAHFTKESLRAFERLAAELENMPPALARVCRELDKLEAEIEKVEA